MPKTLQTRNTPVQLSRVPSHRGVSPGDSLPAAIGEPKEFQKVRERFAAMVLQTNIYVEVLDFLQSQILKARFGHFDGAHGNSPSQRQQGHIKAHADHH